MGTVKALLSLSNYSGLTQAELPYAVAEIQDHRNVMVARRAYRGPLEIVSGTSLIGRLLAQNLRHRGLSRVYGELLSHRIGCGIYIRELAGAAAGSTIAELAERFCRAVLCGVVRWSEGRYVPYLNPPADFVPQGEDRLVLVAPSYEDTELDGATGAEGHSRPEPRYVAPDPPAARQTRRILVLGWNRNVATLMHELSTYEGERFDVTVASLVSERARQEVLDEQALEPGGLERIGCRHVEADYAVEAELRALEPRGFDNILLASSERLSSGEEADTRAVMGYLLLEELLDGVDDAPHVLLELQDPGNEPLLVGRPAEVMVTPLILAHMVVQVALRRELQAVFDELFTASGSELVYRPPARYGLAPGACRFDEVRAPVRARGETLLGIYHARRDVLVLSPAVSAVLQLEDDDELVVMTTYH
jgi:hypothetical protein